jgi:HAD superfamily hydrolase (TIGR01484 family)
MTNCKPKMPLPPLRLLSSDLDGTLIPLEGELPSLQALAALKEYLRRSQLPLVYVTGRHLASIRDVAAAKSLPVADWVIADVGTGLYHGPARDYQPLADFTQNLSELTGGMSAGQLIPIFNEIPGLRVQEGEKLGPFKLSYYVDAAELKQREQQVCERLEKEGLPYRTISSIDPFNGDGLIDLLPEGVSKAYALEWLGKYLDILPEEMVFAGDSGNDFTALVHGFRAILVGNASAELRKKVQASHQQADWSDRLYFAKGNSTAGVWEGLKWFRGSGQAG